MVGQTVFVVKEHMDEVLHTLVNPVPPNSTSGQAMRSLAATCKTADRSYVFDGIGHYSFTTSGPGS
jgi:hypothetical protein